MLSQVTPDSHPSCYFVVLSKPNLILPVSHLSTDLTNEMPSALWLACLRSDLEQRRGSIMSCLRVFGLERPMLLQCSRPSPLNSRPSSCIPLPRPHPFHSSSILSPPAPDTEHPDQGNRTWHLKNLRQEKSMML